MIKKIISNDLFQKSIKSFLVAVVFVQIVFCILYLVQNGGKLQMFEDSILYLEHSYILSTNGWQLIGYSFIINFFRRFLGHSSIWGITIFQGIITIMVFAYTLRVWSEQIWNRTVTILEYFCYIGFLITNPFVFQMILALAPDILSMDILLLTVDLLILLIDGENRFAQYRIIGIVGCVLLLSLLERYYLWIDLTVILLSCMIGLLLNKGEMKKKIEIKYVLLCCGIIVAVLIGFECNHFLAKNKGYMQYSIVADLTERAVYPYIEVDLEGYSEEITAVIPKTYLRENSDRLYKFKEQIGPFLESEYGKQKANQIYLKMLRIGAQNHTKEIVSSLGHDLFYNFTQVFLGYRVMLHNHDSRYGYNLSRFWDEAVKEAWRLFYYGMFLQLFLGIVFGSNAVYGMIRNKNKLNWKFLFIILFPAAAYTTLSTILSPPGADYRTGLCFMVVYLLLAFSSRQNKVGEVIKN